MDEKEYTKSRFIDLSRMSFEKGAYTFSDFLTPAEISDLHECGSLLYEKYELWGGYEGAERCMSKFGSPEEFGYYLDFPIECIKIYPLQAKFAQELSHRDFLGSLMNLGIERSKLGDIVVKEKAAYIFVNKVLSETVCKELTRVRHTSVRAEVVTDVEELPKPELKTMVIQVKSERLDAVVAKTFNLSRSQAAKLFSEGKVFCDGRLTENESRGIKEAEVVSVRGYGKFVYGGACGTSKKGNFYVTVQRYI